MESDVVASYIARRVSFRGESLESIKEDSPAPSTSQGPEGQYIRDEEYWLEDGNLILVVQNTAFRLYIGILAKQSPVLHERIFYPRLSGDDGTEAYRTVHLPGSPHDWRHLLRRLLPKGTSAHKTTFDLRDDFHMISSLLRLSQEYEIKEVMQYAIAALKAVYRDSYDAWIAYDRSVRGVGYDHGEAAAILSQAVVAINVARRHNIPSILPIAFYHCACLGGAIAMGYTHQDGTPEYLAADDVARCINGMQALAAANVENMLFLRDYLPAHRTCKYGGGCKRVWKQHVKEKLMKDWRTILGNHALRGFFQTFPGLSALCDVCKRKARYMLEGRRKKVWQDLPRMFDIAT